MATKLTIEATVPAGMSLEGLPVLLQMMEAAGFTFIKVSQTIQVTTEPSAAERRRRERRNLKTRVDKLEDDMSWIKHTFVGVEEDEHSEDEKS